MREFVRITPFSFVYIANAFLSIDISRPQYPLLSIDRAKNCHRQNRSYFQCFLNSSTLYVTIFGASVGPYLLK